MLSTRTFPLIGWWKPVDKQLNHLLLCNQYVMFRGTAAFGYRYSSRASIFFNCLASKRLGRFVQYMVRSIRGIVLIAIIIGQNVMCSEWLAPSMQFNNFHRDYQPSVDCALCLIQSRSRARGSSWIRSGLSTTMG